MDDDFRSRSRDDEALNLTLDGWEGPLDLLLTLARAQKVDLHADLDPRADRAISRLYRRCARALQLEIAADYLVMAAWLAYLKSCLLLPKDPEQPTRAPRSWRCGCSCGCSGSTRCARRGRG